MGNINYIKPNGTEIKINEHSVEYAESLGWKPKEYRPKGEGAEPYTYKQTSSLPKQEWVEVEDKPVKRKRRTKAEIEADKLAQNETND